MFSDYHMIFSSSIIPDGSSQLMLKSVNVVGVLQDAHSNGSAVSITLTIQLCAYYSGLYRKL